MQSAEWVRVQGFQVILRFLPIRPFTAELRPHHGGRRRSRPLQTIPVFPSAGPRRIQQHPRSGFLLCSAENAFRRDVPLLKRSQWDKNPRSRTASYTAGKRDVPSRVEGLVTAAPTEEKWNVVCYLINSQMQVFAKSCICLMHLSTSTKRRLSRSHHLTEVSLCYVCVRIYMEIAQCEQR